MTLADHEIARFFRIWIPLLGYVKLSLERLARKASGGKDVPNDVLSLRNILWRDDSLLKGFVDENPEGFPPEDLALVASWSRRVSGRFYIYRHLKRHSVFLPADGPSRAYGVLGLKSTFDELAPQPPVLVEAVLLPFEDRISYDGLMTPYNVFFGPGIRSGLDDQYRAAREGGQVLTALLPTSDGSPEEARSRLRTGNVLVLKEFQKELAGSGMTLRKVEEHVANVEALAEALLEGPHPRPLLDVTPEDLRAVLALRPGSRVSLKRLARFLEQTGRIEWGTLHDLPELG